VEEARKETALKAPGLPGHLESRASHGTGATGVEESGLAGWVRNNVDHPLSTSAWHRDGEGGRVGGGGSVIKRLLGC
jgi:hypothetical protein